MSSVVPDRTPQQELAELLHRASPVDLYPEPVELADAVGRVLAAPVYADRDSPPCDVSAADGYALRAADLSSERVLLAGHGVVGADATALKEGHALRVSTGCCIPAEADLVVVRDDVVERDGRIEPGTSLERIRAHRRIRRRGENLRQGEIVVQAGELISAATCVALATFGVLRPLVRRPLRVAVIVTGDELDDPGVLPACSRIRDGNGPGLAALLRSLRWIELTWRGLIADRVEAVTGAVAGALRGSDAVVLTGGVTRSSRDLVPAAIRAAGCETMFEELSLRPGNSVLVARGERDQVLIGLPGDPMSALVLAHWLCLPVLRKRAGFCRPGSSPLLVRLEDAADLSSDGWCFQLVRISSGGHARLVPSRGAADMVAAARADGFVLLPPGARGPGPWPFYPWEV